MKAHAVVFAEPRKLEYREVTLRELQPDEVLVATKYSSISAGTERMLFNGAVPGMPQLRYPFVPGYEAAGTVIDAGSAVEGVRIGENVFVGGSMCYTDVAAAFGGQSSHVIKRAPQVVPLGTIPLAHAPMLALAATALHGVRRLGTIDGTRIAVFGAGAVGQLAAAFARAAGARVVMIERSPDRLARVYADEKVDTSQMPLEEWALEPVHHAIEATGDSAQLANAARLLRLGGSIVLLSYYETLTTPFTDLFVKEATLLLSREWAPPDLTGARDALLDGSVDVSALAEYVVPIERYGAAYETAFNDASILKVLLQWA